MRTSFGPLCDYPKVAGSISARPKTKAPLKRGFRCLGSGAGRRALLRSVRMSRSSGRSRGAPELDDGCQRSTVIRKYAEGILTLLSAATLKRRARSVSAWTNSGQRPCGSRTVRAVTNGRKPGRSSWRRRREGQRRASLRRGFFLLRSETERRRSRTDLAWGHQTAPVLKTGWATGPCRSAAILFRAAA
jgi:hypothetical protein